MNKVNPERYPPFFTRVRIYTLCSQTQFHTHTHTHTHTHIDAHTRARAMHLVRRRPRHTFAPYGTYTHTHTHTSGERILKNITRLGDASQKAHKRAVNTGICWRICQAPLLPPCWSRSLDRSGVEFDSRFSANCDFLRSCTGFPLYPPPPS